MIPGSANPLLLKSAAAAAGGYQVSRSLRFNSSDSAYLSRTPAVAGNRRTFTLSWWIKKSGLTTFQSLFNSFTDANNRTAINFDSSIGAGAPGDYLTMFNVTSATTTNIFQTNALFRDASAWYHIVVATDTTQATSTDRVKLWVNNTLQTFSTYNAPSQNADLNWNSATTHYYGVYGGSPSTTAYGFNGCLAECYLIDGQALTPSSFTEVSATTGQLIPKTYTGTYGTNGFQLKFADNSSNTAATLGKDTSGNSNNWTPNNLSVTAGAGNDSLVDTPTSFGTDTGVGGEVRGNYCTWNPLDTISGNTFSNGNLDIQTVTAAYGTCRGTIGVSTGKWYWEINVLDETGGGEIGILDSVSPLPSEPYLAAKGYVYLDFGSKGNNSSQAGYGASYTTGDLIGVALDLDTGTLTFYKNGSSQGTAYSGLPSGTVFFPVIADYQSANSSKFALNAGQRPFAYQTPGTNRPAATFLALCDTNLGAPVVAKPNTVMDVALYTGNGSTQTISGLNFSPDFVWIKSRSNAANHFVFDVVRGIYNRICTSLTVAEASEPNTLTAFNSDGFSLGSDAGVGGVNTSSQTYVGWAWDAGTTTVTNTAGSITSQVRANVSAGFSVVTWTAPSSGSGWTVGHGLGAAPFLMIDKCRSNIGTWTVYHQTQGATNALYLNTTDAVQTSSIYWNNTAPSSNVFTCGTTGWYGAGFTHVTYCFAPVVGYSSMGSYVGNGSSDGPFVYTGFRPRFLMIKRADASQDWIILDAARNAYNVCDAILYPNASYNELYAGLTDFLSNGFKHRFAGTTQNTNGGTYIYYAVAENPFQYARSR